MKCSDLDELLAVVQAAAAPVAAGSPPAATREIVGKGEERPWRIWLCGLGPSTCTVDWMVSRQDQSRHLDLSALQRAADRLIARHAALRAGNHAEQPMFDATYAAASLGQLRCAGSGVQAAWTRSFAGRLASSSIFGVWPRSEVLPAAADAVRCSILVPTRGEIKQCETATSPDQQAFWVGSTLLQKQRPGEMFHICAVPLFSCADDSVPPEADAVAVALAQPAAAARWYIYAALDHGYCDGPTGAPLYADLLRLYAEESGEPGASDVTDDRQPAEAFATLEKRLRSTRRTPPRRCGSFGVQEAVCRPLGRAPSPAGLLLAPSSA